MNENTDIFEGFSKETLLFFQELRLHNNASWFEKNRKRYEDYVLKPAKSYIKAMGERLSGLVPTINADPRTNKSLFRINRDTRFSKDKSPYKTNLGIVFWDGDLPRMECSVFYFHLEASSLMLGAGIYMFNKAQLQKYRESLLHERLGKELSKTIGRLREKGFELGGRKYKKLPKGYEKASMNQELLLHGGLYASKRFDIPEEFTYASFISFCFSSYRQMLPLQQWLSRLNDRL